MTVNTMTLHALHEYGLCAVAFLLSLLLWAVAWDERDLDGDEYCEGVR